MAYIGHAASVAEPARKATLIHRKNLSAVQLLSRLESTVRYFGTEVDDGLEIAERILGAFASRS